MMPGPDGIALCQTLKSDDDLRHTPLILLTARASLDSKLSGLAAGADDYLTKPFHPDELKARIAALLRMRRMERELRRNRTGIWATPTTTCAARRRNWCTSRRWPHSAHSSPASRTRSTTR